MMDTIPQDLTGRRFGRWTVIEKATSRGKNARWRCVCECGNERDVLAFTLKSGATVSCGCFSAELASARAKHGLSETTEYNSWHQMIARCENPNHRYYHYYGGRGITVCERWGQSVEDFCLDMGMKPSPRHTLDRIDNDGNYEPDNCRWATRTEQAQNRRSSRLLTHDGDTLTMSEWAERLGISPNALYMRLHRGWSVEKALS